MNLLVIYAAMVVSQIVLVALGFVVTPNGGDADTAMLLIPVAATTAGLSVAIPMIPAFAGADRVTRHILRWALAESATIFGFVAWFLGGVRIYQLVCAAIGLLALALAFPRDRG